MNKIRGIIAWQQNMGGKQKCLSPLFFISKVSIITMSRRFIFKMEHEEIKQILTAHIVSPFSSLIAETIVDSLAHTEKGMDHLIRALMGKKFEPKYKVLEKVLIDKRYLPMWRYNGDEMVKQELIVKDMVECMVTKIEPHKEETYHIKFVAIAKDKTETIEDEYYASEEKLVDILNEFSIDNPPQAIEIPF